MANPTTNFGWQMPTSTDLVTDLPADFEVFGQAVDTSLMDLKGGTTGQVLSKASNTDMDFTWTADASGIPATIFDAKGDLIAASAADTAARLAVGTNGQYLSADSTTATGLKWTTLSVDPSYSLLNSGGTSLSSTTTTISGISNKNHLFIWIRAGSTSGTNNQITLRFNSDTGNNYGDQQNKINTTSTYSPSNLFSVGSNTTADSIRLGTGADVAAATFGAWIQVTGGNSSGVKMVSYSFGLSPSTGADGTYVTGGGFWSGSATISSVSIISTSTFDAGTVYIYGA